MKIKNILLFVFFTFPITALAQDGLIFNKLQSAISNYSAKIDECNILRNKNNLESIDIEEIKDIVKKNPSVLSYLSEKAYNNCLQPERGLLAEVILYSTTENKNNQAFVLGESTRKVSFHPDFNDEIIFNKLTKKEQLKLLSITNLETPFDALELMDRIIE